MISKLDAIFYREKDPSIVAVFRIIFGLFMAYQMIYYFEIDYTFQFMAGPEMLFNYHGLSFLKPLPLGILQLVHVLLFVATIFITMGWQYRKSMVFFFLGFTYFSFIDKTLYNNHLYLISLISFVMIFIQADVKYSIKSWKSNQSNQNFIPAWNHYMLVFLISLPYFFGGIAKLGYNWLHSNLVVEIVQLNSDGVLTNLFSEALLVPLIKYGGLIYDLCIVWLLLYKRTRIIALFFVLIFNLLNNSVLFDDIGIFPFFMICSTILFFDSKKVGAWLDARIPKKSASKNLTRKQQKRMLKEQHRKGLTSQPKVGNSLSSITSNKYRSIVSLTLCVFILFQLVFPLRHYYYTDNPEWYGVGLYFSWRMKMQTKEITNFEMTLENTETADFGPIEAKTFLSKNQYIHLFDDPDNLVVLAQYLAPKAGKEYGIDHPAIKANVTVRFNGLSPQQMVQPDVNLYSLQAEDMSNRSWIVPLVQDYRNSL